MFNLGIIARYTKKCQYKIKLKKPKTSIEHCKTFSKIGERMVQSLTRSWITITKIKIRVYLDLCQKQWVKTDTLTS